MDDAKRFESANQSDIADVKTSARKHEDVAVIEELPPVVTNEKYCADYGIVDSELAKYAEGAAIDISLEESRRLRKMIDRRVLVCMILTCFLQV